MHRTSTIRHTLKLFGFAILGSLALTPGMSSAASAHAASKTTLAEAPLALRQAVLGQEAQLIAADGAANDGFGKVVLSSDGKTALIAAAGKTVGSNERQGAAYIFERIGSTWQRQTRLTAADGAANDSFGVSVALSNDGKTALIGAFGKTVGSNERRGAAYVFERNGSTWQQQTQLTAADGAANDSFGFSVALSSNGKTAVIGAPGKTESRGAAYVFERNGSTWQQQTRLTAADGAAFDSFGISVALSNDGKTALIGALKTVGSNEGQGAAYVFERNGSTWQQQTQLTAADGAANDLFGFSVALSSNGKTALIGAFSKTVGSNEFRGAAYVFEREGSTWQQQTRLTAADGAANDRFGFSVALSSNGKTALIGAQVKTIGSNSGQGAAYLFERNGSTWQQQTQLTAADGAANNFFGASVALSSNGKTALIGAFGKTVGSNQVQGAAYVFG
jgi:hypothetical protein